MHAPDPDNPYPIAGDERTGLLRPLVRVDHVDVGRFTYYDDPDGAEHFVRRCVIGHSPLVGGRLVIGSFCAIATGVRFFMGGANHPLDRISGYPFDVFGGAWADGFDERSLAALGRGDTRVGHDVWLGDGAIVLPGVTIDNGAVIGAGAVVARDVPSYAIVVGNPGRVVRRRFDDDTVARLNAIAWWVGLAARQDHAQRRSDPRMRRRRAREGAIGNAPARKPRRDSCRETVPSSCATPVFPCPSGCPRLSGPRAATTTGGPRTIVPPPVTPYLKAIIDTSTRTSAPGLPPGNAPTSTAARDGGVPPSAQ